MIKKHYFLQFISIILIIVCLTMQLPNFNALQWNFDEIVMDKISYQSEKTSINITANTSGNTEDLQYKFVWMKNNWAEWGVLRDFEKSNRYEWKPEQTGSYTIYVDVKDDDKIITKTLDYEIISSWQYEGITSDLKSPQPKKTNINITANTSGNTEDLQYKFVWMKNNWAQWGVLRDFEKSNRYEWNPDQTGNYTIYVDVKDNDEIITKTFDYEIIPSWQYEGITSDIKPPQPKKTSINITANTSGNTEDLQYKFVWMKNNWAQWGVLRDFEKSNRYEWNPEQTGNYTIYVDVKDNDEIITKTLDYEIIPSWQYEGITSDLKSPQPKKTSVNITASTSGNTEDLQYKFVWMKNNWAQWGVLRDFEKSNTYEWKPEQTGNYTIYVDVKDDDEIITKTLDYKIVSNDWNFDWISADKDTTINVNNDIKIIANVSGDIEDLQYKFVWMKNNWSEWGVLKDFSACNTYTWTPKETGNYTIYVDVKNCDKKIITKTINCKVNEYSQSNGIDVSEWQGNIDWYSVKNSGIDFAMVRSGFGRNEPNQVDKKFHENVKGAKKAGVKVGVYHYSYAESAADAVNEANFCLDIIRGYQFEYPIAFDIEDKSMEKLGERELTEICKSFCNTIENAGYYAVIYCNPNWLVNHLYADELLGRYDLWLAHWLVDKPSYSCGLWQYSDAGNVFGISGDVDLDISYRDYAAIMKEKHLNGY